MAYGGLVVPFGGAVGVAVAGYSRPSWGIDEDENAGVSPVVPNPVVGFAPNVLVPPVPNALVEVDGWPKRPVDVVAVLLAGWLKVDDPPNVVLPPPNAPKPAGLGAPNMDVVFDVEPPPKPRSD